MSELAGKLATIKKSGEAVAFVGEPTTSTDDKKYQITDAIKQVLDRDADISVHLLDSTEAAEVGTNETNIKITAHGLETGDLIVNTTRDNAARLITKVDDDNFTVASVADQDDGDSIDLYPTEPAENYKLNRLSGTVTYDTAVSRTIRISGEYLPMATAAYAHEYTYNREAEIHEVPRFLQAHMKRISGLKFASGTLNQWEISDSYFADALTDGDPVVLEFRGSEEGNPQRVWALIEQTEMQAAIDSPQDEIVTFISTDNLHNLKDN